MFTYFAVCVLVRSACSCRRSIRRCVVSRSRLLCDRLTSIVDSFNCADAGFDDEPACCGMCGDCSASSEPPWFIGGSTDAIRVCFCYKSKSHIHTNALAYYTQMQASRYSNNMNWFRHLACILSNVLSTYSRTCTRLSTEEICEAIKMLHSHAWTFVAPTSILLKCVENESKTHKKSKQLLNIVRGSVSTLEEIAWLLAISFLYKQPFAAVHFV